MSFICFILQKLLSSKPVTVAPNCMTPDCSEQFKFVTREKSEQANGGREHSEQLRFFSSPQLVQNRCSACQLWDRHSNVLVWICQGYANLYSFKYALLIVKSWWAFQHCGLPICQYDTYSFWGCLPTIQYMHLKMASSACAHKCTAILKLSHGVMGL